MSLIDSTYFTGPLAIAQLGQQSVLDDLQVFLDRGEPLLLQAALGYQLWEDFTAGLQAPVIDPIWLALRDGVAFQASGMWPPFYWQYPFLDVYRNWYIPQNPVRRMAWVGFTGSATVSDSNPLGPQVFLKAGAGGNNPVSGTNAFTWSALAGSSYTIERRGVGTLEEGVDYSVTNNGQTITLLALGDKFNPNEIFIIKFSRLVVTGSPSAMYASPLAGYIYYNWFRDQASTISAFGTVAPQGENSKPAFSMLKMSDAFNQMSRDIFVLWQFLEFSGTDVYASYDRLKIDYNFFKPINKFGI